MTSTPVKNVGFTAGGAMLSGTKGASDAGFQEIWNSQAKAKSDAGIGEESSQSVKKAPGESLKARDEHRVRTEKREPSRDVEERADISEEEMEKAAEVLGAAAVEVINQLAEALNVSPEEVLGAMEELGMEKPDVLNPQNLTQLFVEVAGAEDASVLVTDESLYESYKDLMAELENVMQESGEVLRQTPEQLTGLLSELRQQTESEREPMLVVETGLEENQTAGAVEETEASETEAMEDAEGEAPKTVSEQTQTVQTETAEAKTRSGSHRGENRQEHNGGQEQGLFAQNLRANQGEAQVQQTSAATSVWDADTQNIMRQIMDYMKINLKPDMSTMEMQLHPASLGTLQVQVSAKNGVVTANFVTQNEAVKVALEGQMIQLQEQFQDQGVRIDAIEVTVQTHQFEQNQEQGRGGGSREQEPARRGRTRRINLNDAIALEEMEEEDVLARNMMEANGNTVDYSV